MSQTDNPYAFPRQSTPFDRDSGMTLRDWFAGQAFGELIQLVAKGSLDVEGDETNGQVVARSAYQFADAMLTERKRGK